MTISDGAARDFVAWRFGSRATGLRSLVGGEWSRAFAMELDGRAVVIRFGQHAADFRKDAVMAACGGAELPIPAVTEIGAAVAGYFAVSDLVAGEPLDGLDEAGMRAALPGLLAALDVTRRISIEGSCGYGNWSAANGRCLGPAASWAEALLVVRAVGRYRYHGRTGRALGCGPRRPAAVRA
jgi:hypothetical protein